MFHYLGGIGAAGVVAVAIASAAAVAACVVWYRRSRGRRRAADEADAQRETRPLATVADDSARFVVHSGEDDSSSDSDEKDEELAP